MFMYLDFHRLLSDKIITIIYNFFISVKKNSSLSNRLKNLIISLL
jgi:hypothetical protein